MATLTIIDDDGNRIEMTGVILSTEKTVDVVDVSSLGTDDDNAARMIRTGRGTISVTMLYTDGPVD